MRSQGLTPKEYAPFARADQGVVAAHKWFGMADYDNMWKQRLGPDYASKNRDSSRDSKEHTGFGVQYAYKPYTAPKSESDYFNWYERHTKHCVVCQKGMKTLTQVSNALQLLSALLAIVSVSFAVAAKTIASPGLVLSGLLAAGCLWMRQKVLDYRQVAFVNSSYRWQKDGGLSLVKGDPIRLY